MKLQLFVSLWVLTSLGCMGRTTVPSSRLPEGARLVDLTYSFDENTPYWPTSPSGFELKQLSHGMTEAGFFYASNTLCAPEHGGTHLDAPIHFAEGKMSAEQLPLERLIAPAVVIDFSADAMKEPDALLQPAHIESFEKEHGPIEPGTIVLVRSGWGKYWPNKKQYLGDDTPGDASKLHFPGISREAAEALVTRKVAAVGIDTASVDYGPSKDFIAHQTLMKADIPAFENVAAMEQLPTRGALILALPMKIRGGSGGPLRIVAVLPPG
ncbi:cyclase family protein [Archangium lansingense]|uniref:Cyclase family protein n=1 Tax=Archangium lansingense TaxID=2995310 RepID=A0ABT4A0Y1_9BACT|nr:cyclase family protein [Archangium lansinium]MCY1075303.1 cyclase family protein [Archangium lansinium]